MSMSRTSTVRAYTPRVPKKNSRRLPWLPEMLRTALSQHFRVLAGLGLFLITLLSFLALLSYAPSDPSLNSISTSQSKAIANLLGLPGSYFADLCFQFFGYASFILCLVSGGWCWRFMSEDGLDHWRGRTAMALAGMLLASAALHILHWPDAFAGGAAGILLSGKLTQWLPPGTAQYLIATGCFLTAVLAVFLACALTLAEWTWLWQTIYARLHNVWRITLRLLGWKPSVRRHDRELADDDATDVLEDDAEDAVALQRSPVSEEDEVNDEPVRPRRSILAKEQRKAASKKPPARQPKLPFADDEEFMLPPLELLARPEQTKAGRDLSPDMLQKNAEMLENVLADFGIQGQITHVSPGPVVTLYELEPAPGIRAARVIALADDIARSMSVRSVRVAVVPGRNVIGIEMPNQKRETVLMRELLESDAYTTSPCELPLILGKNIAGMPEVADLARMPHLLVAGTTGSGKSVSINTMILSLLYRLPPKRCRFIMIDPKMLELSVYEGIPHLLAPVVTEPKKAIVALKWTVREMEERYRAMSKLGVRNIDNYNKRLALARERGENLTRQVQTGFDSSTGKPVFEEQPLDLNDLPYIVVIVDEMADLMLVAGKDIEVAVQRLAQMARAAGIHIIMATQRPSVDVITGTIKANFPTRMSFQVTSKIDSRTILGEMGAEQLLGQGDMLFMAGGGRITRVHGPFVRDSEVEAIVGYLREQGTPDYLDEVTEEVDGGDALGLEGGEGGGDSETGNALYDMAVDIVQREGKASTSFLQRALKLGYNRAADLIDRMEKEGVVSAANHVGKREVFNRRA